MGRVAGLRRRARLAGRGFLARRGGGGLPGEVTGRGGGRPLRQADVGASEGREARGGGRRRPRALEHGLRGTAEGEEPRGLGGPHRERHGAAVRRSRGGPSGGIGPCEGGHGQCVSGNGVCGANVSACHGKKAWTESAHAVVYASGRMVMTGTGEVLTTFSATEPKRRRFRPWRP